MYDIKSSHISTKCHHTSYLSKVSLHYTNKIYEYFPSNIKFNNLSNTIPLILLVVK